MTRPENDAVDPGESTGGPPEESPDLSDGRRLDAGLRAAFDDDQEVAGRRPAAGSVMERLSERTAVLSRISLRDLDDDHSPMLKPLSSGSPVLPSQVGRYQVAGEIARGGVGSVFKARDIDLGRDVALKVLLDDHRDNAEMIQRFVEEAQIGGQLQHPGIVPVHELGIIASDRPYFAMKLVKGQTLARLLDDRSDADTDRQRFVSIFEQICQPVAYAHARGVIHRDLKPSNVMVGPFGEVQVMDWGLAKVLAHAAVNENRERAMPKEASAIHTVRSSDMGSDSLAGSVLGTPAYMPPEQARGEVDRIDERSDVFGLGAILCAILTGEPPYTGASTEEIRRAAENGDLDDAMDRLDGCGADAELVQLAKRCLAFEIRERPRDAAQVARQVSDYLRSLEARARALEMEAAEARIKARGERKARRLTVALASAVVVAVLAGAAGYLRVDGERRERLARTEAVVNQALAEAREQRGEARARGAVDLSAWDGALAAARRARAVAADAGELRRRAEELLGEIERERKIHHFVTLIESIATASVVQSAYAVVHAYESAFRVFFGADLLALDPDDAFGLIRSSGAVRSVVAGLDEWSITRRRLRLDWTQVRALAAAADLDPWRRRLRDALYSADTDAIRALAAEAAGRPLSGADSRLLVVSLSLARDSTIAEAVLRRAIDASPEDCWPYLVLGEVLLMESSRKQEGLRYLAAGAARIPRSVPVWAMLGQQYLDAEDYAAALDAQSRGALLRPGHNTPHRLVLEILLRSGSAQLASELPPTVQRYERLLESGCLVSPLTRVALALARAIQSTNREDFPAAIRTLEHALSFPGAPADSVPLLDAWRSRVRPDLVSYASIDAAFAPRSTIDMIAAGALWRYFPGTREPSEGFEWTQLDFDDSAWRKGESGFGYGDGDDRTVLADMRGSYTTVYIRRKFSISSPADFESVRLICRVDDGFIAYLNGAEIGRFGWDSERGRLAFDAVSEIAVSDAVERTVELPPEALRKGLNLLAVQGANANAESSDLTLDVRLEGKRTDAATAEWTNGVIESFRSTVPEEPAAPETATRRTYLDGRLQQRAGRFADASETFRSVLRIDPGAHEPTRRLVECLLAERRDEATAREIRARLDPGDRRHVPLWNEWLALSLGQLELPIDAVLERLPPALPPSAQGDGSSQHGVAPDHGRIRYVDEVRWVLETIRRRATVRINCGDERYEDEAGRFWERDRFFTTGGISNAKAGDWLMTAVDGTSDDSLYAEGRYFSPGDPQPRGYRIPVPAGTYQVTLHFCENYVVGPGARIFDVLIEGETMLEGLDAFASFGFATAGSRQLVAVVTDGILDIEFRHRVENPRVSAISMERVDRDHPGR